MPVVSPGNVTGELVPVTVRSIVATPLTSATTLYFVKACVPAEPGAVRATDAVVAPCAIVTPVIVGAPAKTIDVAVLEVIAFDALDGVEVPTEFVAVTTNV
jgi:hypothetical protein